MAEEEKRRIEDQRALLGEKGLAEKAKQLEDAIQFNEVNMQEVQWNTKVYRYHFFC